MKLIYSIFFIFFQVSNGLKLGISTRVFSRVSDTCQQASCDFTAVSRKSVATAIIGTFISCLSINTFTLPANAASGLEASQLYAKAESAISENLKDYKNLDKEWASAKKELTNESNILLKASNALSSVSTKMIEYDSNFAKLLEDDLAATNEIEVEVAALKESSGAKYAAASASAAIPARPTTTAALFLKAQNEATTLAQDVCTSSSF